MSKSKERLLENLRRQMETDLRRALTPDELRAVELSYDILRHPLLIEHSNSPVVPSEEKLWRVAK